MLIYQESLGSLFPALGIEGALLEVSIFLELSQYDNPKLNSVISGLENIVPSCKCSHESRILLSFIFTTLITQRKKSRPTNIN